MKEPRLVGASREGVDADDLVAAGGGHVEAIGGEGDVGDGGLVLVEGRGAALGVEVVDLSAECWSARGQQESRGQLSTLCSPCFDRAGVLACSFSILSAVAVVALGCAKATIRSSPWVWRAASAKLPSIDLATI